MKISKHFQLQNAECMKSIKLNYFEHINIFESCKQPGIDNKSSNFIPEMVSYLEIKIQGFYFCKNFTRFNKHTLWSIQKKCYVSITWPFENM